MDIVKRHKEIMESFADYTDGVRVLFLIHRHKEGGKTNNTKVEKMTTRNKDEFSMCLWRLLLLKDESSLPYRIYSAVNDRDMVKAIRKFRFEQLDAESYGLEQYHDFYFDLKNRWIGCLMQHGSRNDHKFLIDIDDNTKLPLVHLVLEGLAVTVFKEYGTKKGTHLVTSPFNKSLLGVGDATVHVDGLLLLDF